MRKKFLTIVSALNLIYLPSSLAQGIEIPNLSDNSGYMQDVSTDIIADLQDQQIGLKFELFSKRALLWSIKSAQSTRDMVGAENENVALAVAVPAGAWALYRILKSGVSNYKEAVASNQKARAFFNEQDRLHKEKSRLKKQIKAARARLNDVIYAEREAKIVSGQANRGTEMTLEQKRAVALLGQNERNKVTRAQDALTDLKTRNRIRYQNRVTALGQGMSQKTRAAARSTVALGTVVGAMSVVAGGTLIYLDDDIPQEYIDQLEADIEVTELLIYASEERADADSE